MRSSVPGIQVANGPAKSAGPSANAAECTRAEPAEQAAIASRSDSNILDLDAPIPAPLIPFHDLAGIFPVGDDATIRDLAQRIDGNVPIDPVILYEDKILDGPALYLACLIVGREPTFESYEGDAPVEFLIGRHISRGAPLSESQRAMAAARVANLQLGANQYSKGLPIGRASGLLNVSSHSVSRARFVLRHGTPDLIAAVDRCGIAVSSAERECKRRAAQASKERNTAAFSAEATAQAECPEQANGISEANMTGETTNTSSAPTLTGGVTTEPSGSTDQAGPDAVENAHALSERVDVPEAAIVPVTWLWPGHIPATGVTAVIGRSTLVPPVAAKLAATISDGGPFPDALKAECANVLWASTSPSSLLVRDRLYCARADLTSPTYTTVEFLGPELDEFGLPIRNLFADLRRLSQAFRQATRVIVIDYVSDYLGSDDLERDINRLAPALHGLQKFAIEHSTAVLLPLQLPSRNQLGFTSAIRILATSTDINSVLIVERDTGSDGTLTKLCEQTERSGSEYRFHVRQKWGVSGAKVPVVEWDSLAPAKTVSPYF
jgi:hypothetical protein